MSHEKTIRIILGPTASGKAKIAQMTAKLLSTEVISLDSMKIYRRFDIGTAKPTPQVRANTVFHQIDILDPTESYSVADYVSDSLEIADEMLNRGLLPLFAGGTVLYYKGIVEGIFAGPAADQQIRDRLKSEAEMNGVPYLHARLMQCDPQAAAKILKNDLRRIIRALEVFEKTGKPISEFQVQFGATRPGYRFLTVGILPDREYCYERCDLRVDKMIELGLVEEARGIYNDLYPKLGNAALQAVGYKELFEHFSGSLSLDEAIENIKRNTRHFARRQYMWFRKLQNVTWVKLERGESAESLFYRMRENCGEFFA